MKTIQSTPTFVLGIILAALMMTSTFYFFGIPKTNDELIHFTFANSVYDSVSQGNFYLSGEPSINHGYGGYALRFYPAVTAYSLAAAYFLTGDWQMAGFLFFWFWMSLSGIGLYLLAKEWLAKNFAFLAAAIYVLEPYHNTQINLLFANAEFVAGCMLTFCFLFMTRLLKDGKTINIVGLAIFYSLLILSHIPLTLIGSIGLGIYGLAYLYFTNGWKDNFFKLSTAVSLGLLASSFYLYRFVSELSWIKHSDEKYISTGMFDYKFFFVDIRGYFFPSDLVLFNFLILLIPPIIVILLKTDRETKRSVYPIMIVTVLTIFMTTSYSQPVWQTVGVLKNVQFPWRWFAVSSIGYGILIAVSVSTLAQVLDGKKLVMTIWTAFFVIATFYFSYNYIIGANLLDPDYFLLKNHEFASTVKYKSTAKTLEFWQTIWSKDSAFEVQEKVSVSPRPTEITKWDGFSKSVKVSKGEPAEVRFAVSYYPHWKAKVNGAEVEVGKTDDGAILVPVTEAESIIELDFVEPFWVKFFGAVSAITWLTLLGLILLNLRKKFLFQTTQNQS